ncbi:MAG: hypothetical protein ACJ8FT_03060 [Sphingomonas sp.]
MHRVVLVCAAFSFAIFASPLAAQQTPPPAETVPPASTAPQPPPFPPMPSSRPSHRWVDVGAHHSASSHHAGPARHHAAATRERHRAATTRERHAKAHREKKHGHQAAVHLSRKTIRQCHEMSYKQLMRNSNCRSLMRQELDTAESRHHKAAHVHKAAARRHKAERREHHRSSRRKH